MTSEKPILLIPMGSYEWHGTHLPPITDSLIATHVAKLLEESIPTAIALPCVNYGSSHEHIDFDNVGSIDHINLYNYLNDLLASLLLSMGPKLIVLINGHGGNLGTIESVSTNWNYKNKVKTYPLHIYTPNVVKKAEELFGFMDTHAGSVETSLYTHLTGKKSITNITNPLFKKKISSGLQLFRNKEFSSTGVINDSETIEINTEKASSLLKFMVEDLTREISQIMNKINYIYG